MRGKYTCVSRFLSLTIILVVINKDKPQSLEELGTTVLSFTFLASN